jgi:hypothetical protein
MISSPDYYCCNPVLSLSEANMSRITLTLQEKELSALIALANQELRDTREQAVLIIRQELSRRGLLSKEKVNISPTSSEPLAEPISQPLTN